MRVQSLAGSLLLAGAGTVAFRQCGMLSGHAVRMFSRQTPSIAAIQQMMAAYKKTVTPVDPSTTPTANARTGIQNLSILRYPHPKLRAHNEEVVVFDEDLKKLCDQLLDIMYSADGIGLAAPQVGINKRIMVFNDEAENLSRKEASQTDMVLINPYITARSEDTKLGPEGCLSFPKIGGHVARNVWIDIAYQTITGEARKEKLSGYKAIIFQHEYDHLDGVLLVDRLIPVDKERNAAHLDRLVRKYGPGGAL